MWRMPPLQGNCLGAASNIKSLLSAWCDVSPQCRVWSRTYCSDVSLYSYYSIVSGFEFVIPADPADYTSPRKQSVV